MKLSKELKQFSKSDKMLLTAVVVLCFLLFVCIYITVDHISDYTSRQASGDAKWEQVNEILTEYDTKIKELEETIEQVTVENTEN